MSKIIIGLVLSTILLTGCEENYFNDLLYNTLADRCFRDGMNSIDGNKCANLTIDKNPFLSVDHCPVNVTKLYNITRRFDPPIFEGIEDILK